MSNIDPKTGHCRICGQHGCHDSEHQQLADFRGHSGPLSTIGELDPLPGQSQVVIADPPTARERAGLFEPHTTLATGRPPNAADAPPFRVDRWTVSIRHVMLARIEAEICVWARLPSTLNANDLEGLIANMPAAAKRLGVGKPMRKVIVGETRLEVMAAIFAYLATVGVD
jgi:hypothetical protein